MRSMENMLIRKAHPDATGGLLPSAGKTRNPRIAGTENHALPATVQDKSGVTSRGTHGKDLIPPSEKLQPEKAKPR